MMFCFKFKFGNSLISVPYFIARYGAIMQDIHTSHDNHAEPKRKSFKQECCVAYDLAREINPT